MSRAATIADDGALDLERPTAALLATIPWEGPWAAEDDDAAVDLDVVSAGAFFEGL